MRLINVEKLTSDMKLAKPIYHDNGRTLLSEGCSNLHKYKDKLLEMGVHYIYVEDNQSKDIKILETINEQTKMQSKKIVHETIKNITLNKSIDIEKVRNVVMNMIDDILDNKNILHDLTDIRTNDSYTFSHSVNVAVISLMIGKVLGYDKEKLLNLGIGALLHDIGKALIPNEILNKPDKLTNEEFSIMQKHSQLGYDTVKNRCDLSPLSRICILSHHEKFDGSGYPLHKKGNDIHEFARIVAIADVFDALTSDRIYRPKWPTYEAVEYLTTLTNSQFDKRLVDVFVKHVATFPNGSTIILSDKRKAIVKEQNDGFPTRPKIKIIEDKNGVQLLQPQEIDLLKELSVVIVHCE